MTDYNHNWRVLCGTVDGMRHRTDLTPAQVTECLDTIVATACKMSATVMDLYPQEVQVLRAEQLRQAYAGDDTPPPPGAA